MRFAFVLALIAVLAACGGAAGTPAPTGPTPAPTATPRPTPSPTPSAPPSISQGCVDQLRDTLDALEELDGRLNVGLTQSAYSERVGDVSVAYSRLDPDDLGAEGANCLETGSLLEDAFNAYVSANTRWSDCFQQSGCTTDSIISVLRGHWSTAHDKIVEARRTFP